MSMFTKKDTIVRWFFAHIKMRAGNSCQAFILLCAAVTGVRMLNRPRLKYRGPGEGVLLDYQSVCAYSPLVFSTAYRPLFAIHKQ